MVLKSALITSNFVVFAEPFFTVKKFFQKKKNHEFFFFFSYVPKMQYSTKSHSLAYALQS